MPDRISTADLRCVCGHKGYDHLGIGRCDDASKRCRCTGFQICDHAETQVLTIHTPGELDSFMTVCEVCRQVLS